MYVIRRGGVGGVGDLVVEGEFFLFMLLFLAAFLVGLFL